MGRNYKVAYLRGEFILGVLKIVSAIKDVRNPFELGQTLFKKAVLEVLFWVAAAQTDPFRTLPKSMLFAAGL